MDKCLPDCEWSDQGTTLPEFITSAAAPVLPQVVRLEPQCEIDFGSSIDWNVPFLIYSHRQRTHVNAEQVKWCKKTKSYVKADDAITIPKDYPGM